jgi:antitoxin HicB
MIPEGDGSWTVDVPDLPGCVTWGLTFDEALEHAQEAITLYVSVLRDQRRPIPPGVGVLAKPTVAVTV